jgi:hypothetical protein
MRNDYVKASYDDVLQTTFHDVLLLILHNASSVQCKILKEMDVLWVLDYQINQQGVKKDFLIQSTFFCEFKNNWMVAYWKTKHSNYKSKSPEPYSQLDSSEVEDQKYIVPSLLAK